MLRLLLLNLTWLLFLPTILEAQERSFNLLIGLPYAIELGGESIVEWQAKGGLVLGVDYWVKNKEGQVWSAGVSYQSFKRKGDVVMNGQSVEQKESFEYLNLHGMPLIWMLGKKERWFAEAGGFASFLLGQQTEIRGAVTNNAEAYERVCFGLSGGLGVRLGDPGSTALLVGIRNDLGLYSFGSGAKSLKFNALCLYVGLGI